MPCTQNLDCPCFIIKFRIYFTSLFFSFWFNKEDWMTCNKSLALLSAALHFICSTDSRSLYFNTALWNGTGYVWFQGWARIIFLKLFLMNHRQIDRGNCSSCHKLLFNDLVLLFLSISLDGIQTCLQTGCSFAYMHKFASICCYLLNSTGLPNYC